MTAATDLVDALIATPLFADVDDDLLASLFEPMDNAQAAVDQATDRENYDRKKAATAMKQKTMQAAAKAKSRGGKKTAAKPVEEAVV